MYGPWPKIRNLYVNTAMKTMNHQYFANIFYSNEKTNEITAIPEILKRFKNNGVKIKKLVILKVP